MIDKQDAYNLSLYAAYLVSKGRTIREAVELVNNIAINMEVKRHRDVNMEILLDRII